uniref:Mitochondrial potassium channel ATP-binding subunit n=1 Tax=Meloidogyne hapla TaxID=6305 RepID=A0A1I8B336_MELHA
MLNNIFNCKLQLLPLKYFNSNYCFCAKQTSIISLRRNFHFELSKFFISSNTSNKLQARKFLNNLLQIGRKSGKPLRLFSLSLGAFYPLNRVAQCKQQQSTRIDHFQKTKQFIAPSSVTWTEFWLLIKPYIHWLICAALAAGFVAALNIQIPIILGQLVNQIYSLIKQNDVIVNFGELKPIAFKLISVYVSQALATFLCIASLSQMGERMCADLRVRLFSHLLELPMPFFDAQNSGELSDRLNFDVQQFKSSFKEFLKVTPPSHLIFFNFRIVGCVCSLYLLSPQMTLFTVGIVPIVVATGALFGAILRKLSARAQSQSGIVAGVAAEAFQNIRTVKIFAMEEAELSLYEREVNKSKSLYGQLGLGIGLFQAASNLFLNGLIFGVLYGGGQLVISNALSPGDLMAFLVTAQTIQRSLAQLSFVFGSGIKVWFSCGRIMEILRLDPQYGKSGTFIIPVHSFVGNIELSNIYFSYPTRPGHEVLKGLNMNIGNGQTIAICGLSGAGKSTVASLIERIYEPVAGRIKLDGIELNKLDPKWLRRNVFGVISQEPVLFSTSIRENIRYGKIDATENEIRHAAALANASQFIEQFPQGYDTVVGERGVTLSGGQKQRIAIARALLKNTPILILDEATSALDTESERLIHQALNRALKGRTVIIIAHRLSTIRNADCIYVLEDGQVVEKGTHQQLIKNRNGKYHGLIKEQEHFQNNDIDA